VVFAVLRQKPAPHSDSKKVINFIINQKQVKFTLYKDLYVAKDVGILAQVPGMSASCFKEVATVDFLPMQYVSLDKKRYNDTCFNYVKPTNKSVTNLARDLNSYYIDNSSLRKFIN
jgi:hypothetical protein